MKDQALYLEADEDITSAIDKLSKTTSESVQIVVPKRSTLLQSVINLKLLKKAAADRNKQLVLVTGDKVATDLAARVGLAVAPTLGAKAVITEAATAPKLDPNDDIIEAEDEDVAPKPAKATKAAAAAAAAATTATAEASFNRRELGDAAAAADMATADGPVISNPLAADVGAGAAANAAPKSAPSPEPPAAEPASAAAPSKAKTPKVPNFGKLQQRLLWIGAAVILIVGYFGLTSVLTHASVTLYAAGTKVSVDTSFSVDPNQTASNLSSGVLAGQTVTFSKDLSSQITPTGQQDAGTKAGGQMTIYNTYDTSSHTLVAGTRLSAPDGNIFVTTADVTVPGATPTLSHGQLALQPGTASVSVTASANGDKYNEAPAKYTVVAYTGDMQAKIYGQGAQMSGGTSKIVTVVSPDDITTAQTAMLAKDKDGSQKSLDGKVPTGYTAISGSTVVTPSNATSNPSVNTAAAGNATVTVHVVYTELAVKQSDYSDFLTARELKQVGATNQIYDNGLASAQVSSTGKDASGRQQFQLSADAYSGAKLDQAAIAGQLAGRKYGDAVDTAGKLPGVQRATINLSPGWISKLPAAAKVKVTIQVASAS